MSVLGDAKFLGENVFLVRKFSEYLRQPAESQFKVDIIQNLRSLTDHFDYKEALLLRKNGMVSLTYPRKDTVINES